MTRIPTQPKKDRSVVKVFFTAGDGAGWAIDEDLRQLREALAGRIQATPLAEAQVVHCTFWGSLAFYPRVLLKDRLVICHADNPPFFYLRDPAFVAVQNVVDLWIARSREAYEQFQHLGLPVRHVPYTVDTGLFHTLDRRSPELQELRHRLGLPENTYILSNFHRDSDGSDVLRPKIQKGPELFLEILLALKARNVPFHALLAGPRRHWLRREMRRAAIPFTFVGEELEGDDFHCNILSRQQLNQFYALTDCYIVSSRWEGGPQSTMEAAAAGCKIISTPLGLSLDILEPVCLYQTAGEGAAIIARDQTQNHLAATLAPQAERVHANHRKESLQRAFSEIYCSLPQQPRAGALEIAQRHAKHGWFRLTNRLRKPRQIKQVAILHQPGLQPEADALVARIQQALADTGVSLSGSMEKADACLIGASHGNCPPPFGKPLLRLPCATGQDPSLPVLCQSIQEAIRLTGAGGKARCAVIPFLVPGSWPEGLPQLATPTFDRTALLGSENPVLFVAATDAHADTLIWNALLHRIPVLYPAASGYGAQVFLGGVAYDSADSQATAWENIQENYLSLQRLIFVPTLEHAAKNLMQFWIKEAVEAR